MSKRIVNDGQEIIAQKEDFVKNYDKMMAVRLKMKKELEDIKTNILFSGVKNMNSFTRLHRDLASEMDDGLERGAYELEKTKAIDSFLERDGNGQYCDMMKDLNKCLIILDENASWASQEEIDKAISDLQNAAETYYNGNIKKFEAAPKDYATVRLDAAGNLNRIMPVFRLENTLLYNSIGANGKKLPMGKYRQITQDYRDKYGMEDVKISKEELIEFHRLSEIRVDFANKMARLYPETLMLLGIYSANGTVDKYLKDSVKTIGQKASWYAAKKEYDKIFSKGITVEQAEEISSSFNSESFKNRVKTLCEDEAFKDVMKTCGTKAFKRWSKIEEETASIIDRMNAGSKRRNDYAMAVYTLINDKNVENPIGTACDCAAKYYVDVILSTKKYAKVLHAILAWDCDKLGRVNKSRMRDFEKETKAYLKKHNILEGLAGKSINETMAVLNNQVLQEKILKSYLVKRPLTSPMHKNMKGSANMLAVSGKKETVMKADSIIMQESKAVKTSNIQTM